MRPSLSLLSSSPLSYSTPLSYATNLLRKQDYDSFLPSYFFQTQAARDAYIALRALNVELTQIDDSVSNHAVGRLRFGWWKDAVKGALSGKPPPHPIPHLISLLPQSSHFSPYHFTRLLTTRESHYLNPSFLTLQDLSTYSAGTQGSLMYLALQACAKGRGGHEMPFEHVGDEHDGGKVEGKEVEVDNTMLDHAASHLAVVMTIGILLRSIPHHATKGIDVIPTEIASRHSLTSSSLFRLGPNAPGLKESVATLVGIAEAELRTARGVLEGTKGVPGEKMGVFLGGIPAQNTLRLLQTKKVDFDVFHPDLRKLNWAMMWRMWRAGRRQEF